MCVCMLIRGTGGLYNALLNTKYRPLFFSNTFQVMQTYTNTRAWRVTVLIHVALHVRIGWQVIIWSKRGLLRNTRWSIAASTFQNANWIKLLCLFVVALFSFSTGAGTWRPTPVIITWNGDYFFYGCKAFCGYLSAGLGHLSLYSHLNFQVSSNH